MSFQRPESLNFSVNCQKKLNLSFVLRKIFLPVLSKNQVFSEIICVKISKIYKTHMFIGGYSQGRGTK